MRALLVGLLVAGTAHGMGGNLDRPCIAIPANDSVARKLHDALNGRGKDFAGGSFVNAHSVLYYAGGADGVNALIRDLAAVDGATVQVKLSKDAGEARLTFPSKVPAKPCDCKVEHSGWGDAHVVTLTVYLGKLDPAKLELPAVSGRATGKPEVKPLLTPIP